MDGDTIKKCVAIGLAAGITIIYFHKRYKNPYAPPEDDRVERGYVDGCFDLIHSGHLNAIRQAKLHCKHLVVGIHSDEEIARNKGHPVMNQKERYEMLRHLKWVDQVAEDVPYSPSLELLAKYNVDKAFHGDDMPVNEFGVGAYDAIKAAGKLKIVRRTEGVSTTDFIGRLMNTCGTLHHTTSGEVNEGVRGSTIVQQAETDQEKLAKTTLAAQGIKLLQSTRRIAEFSKPFRPSTKDDTVVYIDGAFDMFNIAHATTLKKAKAMGSYLVVGLYDDTTVNTLKGSNYPVATLNERVLCVSSCKWVDDVIIGAPLKVTENMITSLGIDVVACGSHTKTHYFHEKAVVHHMRNHSGELENLFLKESGGRSYYDVPYRMGILKFVDSDFPDLNTQVIAHRVAHNRLAYVKRNADRVNREMAYNKQRS